MLMPQPGDYVPITHECEGLGGSRVKHDLPVLVTSVAHASLGGHVVRGVRCDGSVIQWRIRDNQVEEIT